uniref:Uncharacterized protein n=1 Tax=Ciona intestinalis TaxID=7719 RepID=F6RLR6_CIOIN
MEYCFWYFTIAVFSIYCLLSWQRRPKNFPPGPRGFPVLGIVPYFGKYPEKVLSKFADQYESRVMSFRMGRMDWIVLNDIETITQALVKQGEDFAGRPKSPLFDMLTNGCGIVFVDGEKWKAQRKFGIMTLRRYMLHIYSQLHNRLKYETRIKNFMKCNLNKKMFIQTLFRKAVTNVTCSVLMGKRYDYDDPDTNFFMYVIIRRPSKTVVMYSPILRFIPPFRWTYKKIVNSIEQVTGVIRNISEMHKQDFDSSTKRDFVDHFIAEMNKEGEYFTDEQLHHYTRDLLVAAINTTTAAFGWCVVSLLRHPECQEKIWQEVDKVIVLFKSGNETPSCKHQENMPYMRSFIQEIHRHRSIATLNLPHRTVRSVRLCGYDIPKDTPVLTNIWRVHNNQNVWKNPHEFRPDRHLDSNGNFVSSNNVIPFACGYRRCLGEQIAKAEIFLFIVNIVKRFHLVVDQVTGPPTYIHSFSDQAKPHPYRIKIFLYGTCQG